MDDRGGIHAAGAAQKLSAFQQANIRICVETVLTLGARGRNESEMLPGAQDLRGNAHNSGDIADAQIAASRRTCDVPLAGVRQNSFSLTTPGPSSNVREL